MELAAVGHAGLVVQLVIGAGGLITKIMQAVETARQNKQECGHLARRLSTIAVVLHGLPPDPPLLQPLGDLNATLHQAHQLVLDCQNWSVAGQFMWATRHAERFRAVNARIDSHLALFPVVGYAAIAARLDRLYRTAVLPSPGYTSGAMQTPQMVASDYPAERIFTWAEIASITHFDVELSRGSSGTVYKGRLPGGGREVVVKILNKHRPRRMEMEQAFMAEFQILRSIRHDHIVPLVGWCAEEAERRVFVYEHMSNGTLKHHLQRVGGGSTSISSSSPVSTSWAIRVKVLLGVSMAIQYLHRVAAPPVIHRNVNSCNILLDTTWTPRLSSFGSAVLQEAGDEHGGGGQLVSEIVGSFKYLDPEYHDTTRVSPASDVYSFGVVMLETLTGKDPAIAVDSALPVIRNGRLRDMLDRRLATSPSQLEALELVALTAEWCLCRQGKDRPAMSNVVANLETALWNIAA